jgi:hypothetical protein
MNEYLDVTQIADGLRAVRRGKVHAEDGRGSAWAGGRSLEDHGAAQ